jgi:hypothetical protein
MDPGYFPPIFVDGAIAYPSSRKTIHSIHCHGPQNRRREEERREQRRGQRGELRRKMRAIIRLIFSPQAAIHFLPQNKLFSVDDADEVSLRRNSDTAFTQYPDAPICPCYHCHTTVDNILLFDTPLISRVSLCSLSNTG